MQEEEPSKWMKQQVFNIRQFACLEGLSVREFQRSGKYLDGIKKCGFYSKETHSNEVKETKQSWIKRKENGVQKRRELYTRFFI